MCAMCLCMVLTVCRWDYLVFNFLFTWIGVNMVNLFRSHGVMILFAYFWWQIYGMEKLHDALLNRPKEKPLITVCLWEYHQNELTFLSLFTLSVSLWEYHSPALQVSNHVASVDDPFVIASLLPPNVLLDAQNLRWTLCATDRCFSNPVTSAFFRCVRVLPVSRGDGIYQKVMAYRHQSFCDF